MFVDIIYSKMCSANIVKVIGWWLILELRTWDLLHSDNQTCKSCLKPTIVLMPACVKLSGGNNTFNARLWRVLVPSLCVELSNLNIVIHLVHVWFRGRLQSINLSLIIFLVSHFRLSDGRARIMRSVGTFQKKTF